MDLEAYRREAQAHRKVIRQHLTRFHALRDQGKWKEAMEELNRFLDGIVKPLQNTQHLIHQIHQKTRQMAASRSSPRLSQGVYREYLSDEICVVQYPDGRWVLVRELPPE